MPSRGVCKSLAATYSPILLRIVPSAMRGLTAEFGMGSGVSLSLLPPRKLSSQLLNLLCHIPIGHIVKKTLEILVKGFTQRRSLYLIRSLFLADRCLLTTMPVLRACKRQPVLSIASAIAKTSHPFRCLINWPTREQTSIKKQGQAIGPISSGQLIHYCIYTPTLSTT